MNDIACVTYSLHLANAGSGGLLVRLPYWAKHRRAIPVCPTVLLLWVELFRIYAVPNKICVFWGKSGDFSFCMKFNSRYFQAFSFAFGWLYYNTGTLVCPCLLERLFSRVYFHLCAQICAVLICQILHDFPKRQFISPPREDGRILAKCC